MSKHKASFSWMAQYFIGGEKGEKTALKLTTASKTCLTMMFELITLLEQVVGRYFYGKAVIKCTPASRPMVVCMLMRKETLRVL